MRNSFNQISSLKEGEVWEHNTERIKDCIERFYTNLYSEPFKHCPTLEGVEFDKISEEDQMWLERMRWFMLLIAWRMIRCPNGFPPTFIKIYWDVVGKDVKVALQAFYVNDQWYKSLSATFITLILKKKEYGDKRFLPH